MKPRIYKSTINPGSWVCLGVLGFRAPMGIGNSPAKAFADFLADSAAIMRGDA